jgi:hypothetical protein
MDNHEGKPYAVWIDSDVWGGRGRVEVVEICGTPLIPKKGKWEITPPIQKKLKPSKEDKWNN